MIAVASQIAITRSGERKDEIASNGYNAPKYERFSFCSRWRQPAVRHSVCLRREATPTNRDFLQPRLRQRSMKILIIEDDQEIAQALAEALTSQHYIVDIAADGQAGWVRAVEITYDLLLLDIMLPKIDGICLCQQLRSQGYQVPILMLTAKDTNTDKVMGLDAGADDYVVKPFSLTELLARMRALLRRGRSSLPPVLEWGELRCNPSNHEVSYGAIPLDLTPKEYALLKLFLYNRHRTFTRSEILDRLWTLDDSPAEDAVKTHICGIRQKLKSVGAPTQLIETVYGVGYRLKQEF